MIKSPWHDCGPELAICAPDDPRKSGCAHAPGPVRLAEANAGAEALTPPATTPPAGGSHPGYLPAYVRNYHDTCRQD
jgi:hypothetical protein